MSLLYPELELLDKLLREPNVDKVVTNEQCTCILSLRKRKNKKGFEVVRKLDIDVVMIDGTKHMIVKNHNELFMKQSQQEKEQGKDPLKID